MTEMTITMESARHNVLFYAYQDPKNTLKVTNVTHS
jgi:hypothetical protein